MGNIEQRKIKSFFPSSQNLDNPSTKSQENHQYSSQSFATSYDPKKQSLLQLTLTDNAEIQLISQNISLYSQQSKTTLNQGYPSISSLKEFYKVKKDGYCTQQYIFYLIFQGCSCCGLSDEFGLRKMMSKRFSDDQILSILKTYLAGIFIYINKFRRNIGKIDLDDIGFEILSSTNNDQHFLNQNQQHVLGVNQRQGKRRMRIFFSEPWLKQKRQQEIMTVNEVNILLQNPSPERLRENTTKIIEEFDQFEDKPAHHYGNDPQKNLLSLLFSIGVIGLKLLEMGFVDDIYMRAPNKRVNLERIKDYLEKHQSANHNRNYSNNVSYDPIVSRKKLIAGLKLLLLSNSPEERERIYEFWSVKLDSTNYLDQINLQYSGHFQTEREDTQILQSQSLQGNNLNDQLAGNSNFPVRNRGRSKTTSMFGKFYDRENASLNLDQTQTNHHFPQQSIIVQKDPFPNRNYVYKQDQMKLSKVTNTQINVGNFNNPNFIHTQQQIYQQTSQSNNQNQHLPPQNSLIQNRMVSQRKASTIIRNSDAVFGQQQQSVHNNNQQSYLSNSINLKGQIINQNYQSFPNGGQNKVIMQDISQKPTHERASLYTGV